MGLLPSAQGGVEKSMSNVGVDPSQQTLSSLGHLLPPGRPKLGELPSAQVSGLSSSGQLGLLLSAQGLVVLRNRLKKIQNFRINHHMSPSKTGADPSPQVGAEPSEQAGLDPSSHFGPRPPGPPGRAPLRAETIEARRTVIRNTFIFGESYCWIVRMRGLTSINSNEC